MIKLTFVCDKCSAEVEKKLDTPLELDRANWRNAPDLWVSVGVEDAILFLCPECNGDVVRQKQQIATIEAQVKVDVTTAISAAKELKV